MDPGCSSKTSAWLKRNTGLSSSSVSLCTGEDLLVWLHLNDSCWWGQVIKLPCLFGPFRGKRLKIHLSWGDKKMRAILPLVCCNFSFSQRSYGRSPLRISRLRRSKRSWSTGMSSAYVNFLMPLSRLHHSKSWQESNESASHISVQRWNSHRDSKEKSQSPHWPWM